MNFEEYVHKIHEKYNPYIEIWSRYYHNGEPTDLLVSNLGNLKQHVPVQYKKKENTTHVEFTLIKRYYQTRARILSTKKRIKVLISRVVAITFIPIPLNYLNKGLTYNDLQVDHIDAKCKWDNSVFNIQYLTPEENKLKAKWNKEHPIGEDRPNTTLKNDQVISACDLLVENKLTL